MNADVRRTRLLGVPHVPREGRVVVRRLVRNVLAAWRLPRWRWALIVALLSDALGFGVALWPPLQWLLDAVTASVLFAVLGFRWPLLSALAIEAVPVLQLFPAWTLVVVALASAETLPIGGKAEGARDAAGSTRTP